MNNPKASAYSLAGKRVWVAGHNGMVGSGLMRRLQHEDCELLTVERDRVDLRRQAETEDWIAEKKPDAIFLAAAKVGGIVANDTRPAEFIYDNMALEVNIIEAARRASVERLLFLGSSCVYPKFAPQPIREDALLSGPLEPTNQWYAVAKIAGIKLCQAYRRQYACRFISAMPTNLYGSGDNFDLNAGHVIPALIRKIHEAKARNVGQVEIWGSGTPKRDFLHVDDCADGLVFMMKHYDGEPPVNLGSGAEIAIRDLAWMLSRIIEFKGELRFDQSRPDGTPRKLLDTKVLCDMGWQPRIDLKTGLSEVYQWFVTNYASNMVRGVERHG